MRRLSWELSHSLLKSLHHAWPLDPERANLINGSHRLKFSMLYKGASFVNKIHYFQSPPPYVCALLSTEPTNCTSFHAPISTSLLSNRLVSTLHSLWSLQSPLTWLWMYTVWMTLTKICSSTSNGRSLTLSCPVKPPGPPNSLFQQPWRPNGLVPCLGI